MNIFIDIMEGQNLDLPDLDHIAKPVNLLNEHTSDMNQYIRELFRIMHIVLCYKRWKGFFNNYWNQPSTNLLKFDSLFSNSTKKVDVQFNDYLDDFSATGEMYKFEAIEQITDHFTQNHRVFKHLNLSHKHSKVFDFSSKAVSGVNLSDSNFTSNDIYPIPVLVNRLYDSVLDLMLGVNFK